MPQSPPRPLMLVDLMALVAAAAGGIMLQRWVNTPIDPAIRRGITSTSYVHFPAQNWLDHLWLRTPSYYALVLTATLAVLRWVGPRPPARRVVRQPGTVACLAVCGAMTFGLGLHYLRRGLHIDPPNSGTRLFGHGAAWDEAVRWAAPAVGGAWAALLLSGTWRPERSWIDRAGRLLGWYWVSYAPLMRLTWPIWNWLAPIPMDQQFEP